MDIPFNCVRCGNCCRGQGDVCLRDREVMRISGYLMVTVDECVARYTRLSSDRRCLSLIDSDAGACVFLGHDNRCLINEVKPEQCSSFPFAWEYPGWREECMGAEDNKKVKR